MAASHLFSSNGLLLVAVRLQPTHLLLYLSAAALQVSAAWLAMTVTASASNTAAAVPSLVPLVVAVVDTVADVFLAGVVASIPSLQDTGRPLLCIRVGVDAVRVLYGATVVFAIDERVKSRAKQTVSSASAIVSS